MFHSRIVGVISEPNSLAGLLDLAVGTASARKDLEDYWIPELLGDSALPLLKVIQTSETEIWNLCRVYLKADEINALEQSIDAWRAQLSHQPGRPSMAALNISFINDYLDKQVPTPASAQGGLLTAIRLDPLAGLDPATRELTQTRLFAERVAYAIKKLPQLTSLQVELLGYNLALMPEVQATLQQTASLTESADRISRTAEALPTLIQEERALIINTFKEESAELNSLANQVQEALLAGSQMASNLHLALLSFDRVMDRFDKTNAPVSTTNSEPFRIGDYTETARQIDSAAQRLTQLLLTFDQTLGSTNLQNAPAQAEDTIRAAKAEGQALVDYTFKRLLLLTLVVFLMVIACKTLGRRANPPASGS